MTSVFRVEPIPALDHEPEVPSRNCHCISEQSKPPFILAVKLVDSPFSQISLSSMLMVIEGSGTTIIVIGKDVASSQPLPSAVTTTLKSRVCVKAPVE